MVELSRRNGGFSAVEVTVTVAAVVIVDGFAFLVMSEPRIDMAEDRFFKRGELLPSFSGVVVTFMFSTRDERCSDGVAEVTIVSAVERGVRGRFVFRMPAVLEPSCAFRGRGVRKTVLGVI